MENCCLNHIAFIVDGNGRWAKEKGMPRTYGHLKGAEALKDIVHDCLDLDIPCVSFFCFSTENWSRPTLEVNHIMKLVEDNLTNPDTLKWFLDNNVRFVWNGQSRNLSSTITLGFKNLMEKTQNCKAMTVQIMFNYSSRLAIVDAANKLVTQEKEITIDSLNEAINKYDLPPLDLLIRTSGEQRISNFMLWELSYAELIFSPVYWPQYDLEELKHDIEIYKERSRRFGGL